MWIPKIWIWIWSEESTLSEDFMDSWSVFGFGNPDLDFPKQIHPFVYNVRQHLWRNAGQRMHCFRANDRSHRSENPRAVCVFVSPVLIPSSTNRRVDSFASCANSICNHLPAGIYLLPTARWHLAIAITSHKKLNSKNDRSFSYLSLIFGYLVLGKDTKNAAGNVNMKKTLFYYYWPIVVERVINVYAPCIDITCAAVSTKYDNVVFIKAEKIRR